MAKKYSEADVAKMVNARSVGRFVYVRGSYANVSSKLVIECSTCGATKEILLASVSPNTECVTCATLENEKKFRADLSRVENGKYQMEQGCSYTGSQHPITIVCLDCDNKLQTTPNTFLSQNVGCNRCRSREAFEKKIAKKFEGHRYEVGVDFVNVSTDATITCLDCGKKHRMLPSNFRSGCSCHRDKAPSLEQLQAKINNKFGEDACTILEYKGSDGMSCFKCEQCGTIFEKKWRVLMNSNHAFCKDCVKKARRKAKEESIDDLRDFIMKMNPDFKPVGEFFYEESGGTLRKCVYVEHLSPSCEHPGNIFKVNVANFKKSLKEGHSCPCPTCSHLSRRKTTEQFVLEVARLSDDYSVEGQYRKEDVEVAMKHKKCEGFFMVTPKAFLHQSSRCPYCRSSSKAVTRIERILKDAGVSFKEEYKTGAMSPKNRPYRFDLAVFNGEELLALIEYDGEHHFPEHSKKMRSYGLPDHYDQTHEYDLDKNEQCERREIPLLRVRYDQQDLLEEMIGMLLASPELFIYDHNPYVANSDYYSV